MTSMRTFQLHSLPGSQHTIFLDFDGATVSYEVGHNFGLLHDGNAHDYYASGHGSWAPIMGAGFDRPVTQWSHGDHAGANNQQDDLAVIGRTAHRCGPTRLLTWSPARDRHRGAVEGYDGYASLGAYTLSQSGCEPPPGVP
ncbi:hypothetical protein ACT8ZV_12745 [Nocardioides sp. MAHUQ-72]|uniref:hypothetical protein n=1 Tax=unclassified Nocardioides TaxID=2615069 RepID=UPI00361195BD